MCIVLVSLSANIEHMYNLKKKSTMTGDVFNSSSINITLNKNLLCNNMTAIQLEGRRRSLYPQTKQSMQWTYGTIETSTLF